MTDRFVCPEPSEAAITAWMQTPLRGGYEEAHKRCIAAAYAVDVPGIVKAELAALRESLWPYNRSPKNEGERAKWFAANAVDSWMRDRFPEAAPETPAAMAQTKAEADAALRAAAHQLGVRVPTPRGAPEPGGKREGHLAGCCIDTDHKGPCLRRCEETAPTPSAPVECDHDFSPHFCHKCGAPAEGPVAGSVPEEPIADFGCRRCQAREPHQGLDCLSGMGYPRAEPKGETGPLTGGEALRQWGQVQYGYLPKSCTACACKKCKAMEAFVKEWAKSVNARPPIDFFDEVTFRAESELRSAARTLLEVK